MGTVTPEYSIYARLSNINPKKYVVHPPDASGKTDVSSVDAMAFPQYEWGPHSAKANTGNAQGPQISSVLETYWGRLGCFLID